MNDNILPMLGVVTEIRVDTPDIKTFRVEALEGGKCFEHMPGQCAMLSIPGVGEAMFSITSSPTLKEYQEFSIKKCGCLTSWLHLMDVGQQITIRGPYGNPFPVDTELKGKDLLFIAGGVGLAPLHSVINYCLAKRENYGKIDVVYGSRSKQDLVDYREIIDEVLGNWGKVATAACVEQEENEIYPAYADHDVTVVDLTEEELAEFRTYGEQVVLEQERGDEVLAAIKEIEDSLP